MNEFVFALFLIYVVSIIWYQVLFFKEVGTCKNCHVLEKFMYVLFFLIGFVPILNTVLAIKAHKDNISNN